MGFFTIFVLKCTYLRVFCGCYRCENVTKLAVDYLQVLAGLGMTPIAPAMTPPRPPTYITVMLDGKLVGHVRSLQAPVLVSRLRDIKAAKLAEEESLPDGAHTIMLDVSLRVWLLLRRALCMCSKVSFLSLINTSAVCSPQLKVALNAYLTCLVRLGCLFV